MVELLLASFRTIQNPNNSSYTVRNALIDKCPYLSEEVLIELINRTPAMGQWDLCELLINNSPLTFPVINAYYEAQPLQPLYHSFLLSYQDGASTLTSIKSQIKRHRSVKNDVQNDYIRMMTVEMEELPDLEKIKVLLQQDETNNAIKTKYAIALKEGNVSSAQDLLNQYTPTSDDDAWVELQEVVLEINNSGSIEELSSSQIITLESFIENNKREKHIAKVMLWMGGNYEYAEDIELPDENK